MKRFPRTYGRVKVWTCGRRPKRGRTRKASIRPYVHTSIRLIALLALSLSGCDDSVNPFVGEERPFTLWGYLDAGSDVQQVRVFTIENRPGTDRSGPIDARVTSTDLDTGDVRPWTDTEVVYADSSVGHVFRASFRAEHGHRYRLEVARSDGATSRVEVTVPPAVSVDIDVNTERTLIPMSIQGSPPQLVGVEIVYDTWTVPAANPWPPGTPAGPAYHYPVSIPYKERLNATAGGWRTEIDLVADFTKIKDAFKANCLATEVITIRNIELRLLVASKEWDPPGGAFDPEVLAQPGAFSNIENGFGFFGGGFSVIERWVPPLSTLRTVGFSFDAPCAMGTADIPACQPHPEPCFNRGG